MESPYIIELFSAEWIRNTTICIAVLLLLPLLFKFTSEDIQSHLFKLISALMAVVFFLEQFWIIYYGNWEAKESLPLHLCSISLIICIFLPYLQNPNPWFQFVFYTGILGGAQALLTPQINHFDGSTILYLTYYVVHVGIMLLPIYLLQRHNFKLERYSWFNAFKKLNVLMLILLPLNYFLDANYMYVNATPVVYNPFIIGEWPYYLIYLEGFVLLLSYGLYVLTVQLSKRFRFLTN